MADPNLPAQGVRMRRSILAVAVLVGCTGDDPPLRPLPPECSDAVIQTTACVQPDVNFSLWLDSGTVPAGQHYCLINNYAAFGLQLDDPAQAITGPTSCLDSHHCGDLCAAVLGTVDGPRPRWFVACDPDTRTIQAQTCP